MVWSHTGMTTRNRDQASQAQNLPTTFHSAVNGDRVVSRSSPSAVDLSASPRAVVWDNESGFDTERI